MKKKILLGSFILGSTLLLIACQNMTAAKKSMSVQEEKVANHLTKIGLKKEGINAILGNFSDKVDTRKKSANFPNEFGWN